MRNLLTAAILVAGLLCFSIASMAQAPDSNYTAQGGLETVIGGD